MRQIKIAMLLIIAFITLCACPDNNYEHKYFTIVNKSPINLRCQIIVQSIITPADTIYDCGIIPFLISADSSYFVESGEYRGGWETVFRGIPYLQLLLMEDSIYMDYFFKYNYNCDTIRKYVPVLHRYQLKLEDLQRMNWTVVYPPEE